MVHGWIEGRSRLRQKMAQTGERRLEEMNNAVTENGIEKEEMERRAMTKAGHKMVQRRNS